MQELWIFRLESADNLGRPTNHLFRLESGNRDACHFILIRFLLRTYLVPRCWRKVHRFFKFSETCRHSAAHSQIGTS